MLWADLSWLANNCPVQPIQMQTGFFFKRISCISSSLNIIHKIYQSQRGHGDISKNMNASLSCHYSLPILRIPRKVF